MKKKVLVLQIHTQKEPLSNSCMTLTLQMNKNLLSLNDLAKDEILSLLEFSENFFIHLYIDLIDYNLLK